MGRPFAARARRPLALRSHTFFLATAFEDKMRSPKRSIAIVPHNLLLHSLDNRRSKKWKSDSRSIGYFPQPLLALLSRRTSSIVLKCQKNSEECGNWTQFVGCLIGMRHIGEDGLEF